MISKTAGVISKHASIFGITNLRSGVSEIEDDAERSKRFRKNHHRKANEGSTPWATALGLGGGGGALVGGALGSYVGDIFEQAGNQFLSKGKGALAGAGLVGLVGALTAADAKIEDDRNIRYARRVAKAPEHSGYYQGRLGAAEDPGNIKDSLLALLIS